MTTAADEFIALFNKVHGPAVLPASQLAVPRRFTSGSLSLDVALGGGWPGNQWCEIIGEESVGKTAVALKTIAANQHADPEFMALWVAAEIYDTGQANALGVDNSRVMVCPTQNMEFAFQLMLEATSSQAFDAVILDSYPALIVAEEDDKGMEDLTVAGGARTFARYWRKAGKATKRASDGSERPIMGLIINQYRDKIGGFSRYGIPQTSPGGHAKDYAYFVRLKITRGAFITEKRPGMGEVPVGQEIKFKTVKNKSAAPQQEAAVDFYFRDAPLLNFRRGDYDLGKEYVKVGIDLEVIAKSGGWLYFDDRKWNGKPALETDIRAEPELAGLLASQVLAAARARAVPGLVAVNGAVSPGS